MNDLKKSDLKISSLNVRTQIYALFIEFYYALFLFLFFKGTGYEYDGNVFVAWVLQVRRAEVVTK
jgi:hypothetical protein